MLIILAAVSINTVFKSNFIGIATNGTINYAETQIEESNQMDSLDKQLVNVVNKIKEVRLGENSQNIPNMPSIKITVSQNKINVFLSRNLPEDTTLTCVIKEKENGIEIGRLEGAEELYYSFDNLEQGKTYLVNIHIVNDYETLVNEEYEVNTLKVIEATAAINSGMALGAFREDMTWYPSGSGQTLLAKDCYIQGTLNMPISVKTLSFKHWAGAQSDNLPYSFSFVLQGSNDGTHFENISDTLEFVTYRNINQIKQEIFQINSDKKYIIYRIQFLSGGYQEYISYPTQMNLTLSNITFFAGNEL